MVDIELGLGLVYNGAVYNYRELRHELEALGYGFVSDGDTEVVLKAYHAWGETFVERLEGMFALALWEIKSGRLHLARDRLGIKPLYTAAISGGLRFASSLPALLAAGGVDTALDPVAVQCYLTLNGAVPAPRTLLAGVRKVPPATLLTIEANGVTKAKRFWRLGWPDAMGSTSVAESMDETTLRDELLAALRRAVRRRLTADGPVGAFLSGGLDSSLVVGLMAEVAARPVQTFSIGFQRVGGLIGHEFPHSDLIAQRFGTNHHQLSIGPLELVQNLEECVRAMSEPQTGRDAIGFYLLARQAADGVRVVQAGQGADELFGGYAWHSAVGRSTASADLVTTYRRAAFGCDHQAARDVLHPSLIGEDHSGCVLAKWLTSSEGDVENVASLSRVLRYETQVQLCEDPLQRIDNMTMAWGLEARVPFLDHELVELAARVPDHLKVKGRGKHLLREAARAILPSAIINRRKAYFPVPSLWSIRGSVLAFTRDVLTQPRARRRQLFRTGYVDNLLAAPASRRSSKRLWEATVLEYWLQVHGI